MSSSRLRIVEKIRAIALLRMTVPSCNQVPSDLILNIDLTNSIGMPRLDGWQFLAANLLQQIVEGGTQLSSTTYEFHDGGFTRKCNTLLVAHGRIEHALQFIQCKRVWHR